MDDELDPYAKRDSAPIDLRSYLRAAALAIAFILIFSGLYLTFEAFGFVRDLIAEPDILITQLDAWVTVEEPEPEAAEAPPETAEIELLPEGGIEAVAEDTPQPAVPQIDFGRAPPRPDEDTWPVAAIHFVDALKSGGLARVMAAIAIFLFATLLVKIPLALIAEGTKILSRSTADKE